MRSPLDKWYTIRDVRHKTKVAAIAAAAVIAASGIAATAWAVTGHHPSAARSVKTTQATAATTPPGCQQARLVTAAISSNLRANPGGTAIAFHQLRDLARSLPATQLKLDIDKAALDLALFRQYAAMGGPATRAAKDFAADLGQIRTECA